MTEKDNLFEILQNPTIGVLAIHSFISGYSRIQNDKTKENPYPPFNSLFYVLPLIYNPSSLQSFKSSFELYTALSKNKELTLGLQDRATKMTEQTFESINLGFSKGIFLLVNDIPISIGITPELKGRNILNSMKISDTFFREIKIAATRLGAIFAKKDEKMIQLTLNIRY